MTSAEHSDLKPLTWRRVVVAVFILSVLLLAMHLVMEP